MLKKEKKKNVYLGDFEMWLSGRNAVILPVSYNVSLEKKLFSAESRIEYYT